MNHFILIVHYPDSTWGDDIVCFHVPASCPSSRLLNELEIGKCGFDLDEYDSPQDYADALLNQTAEELVGTWNYVAQIGSIDITNE